MINDAEKVLLTKWTRDWWTDHNKDAVGDVFTDDIQYRDVPYGLQYNGHTEMLEFLQDCTKAIPDFSMEVKDSMKVGEHQIAVEWEYWGTFTLGEARKKFRSEAQSVIDVRDGKISRCFDYYDPHDFFAQIGYPGMDVDGFNTMIAKAVERKKEKMAAAKK